jgi:hypothetical protein
MHAGTLSQAMTAVDDSGGDGKDRGRGRRGFTALALLMLAMLALDHTTGSFYDIMREEVA